MAYANLQQTALDWDALRQEFTKFLLEEKPLKDKMETDFDVITTKGTDIPLEKIRQYTKRLGISLGSTPDGEVFVNGKPVEMSGVCQTDPFVLRTDPAQYHSIANLTTSASRNRIPDSISPRAGASSTIRCIYKPPTVVQIHLGTLSSDIADISVHFYDLPESHRRRNKLVYPPGKLSNAQLTSLPQLFEGTSFKAEAGSYLQRRKISLGLDRGPFAEGFLIAELKDTPLVTSYAIADFDTEDGLDLLREIVESLVYHSHQLYPHPPTCSR